MKKFVLFLALLTAMLSPCRVSAQENSYNLPEEIQQGNILHCFNWTFSQIIEELPAIAEAGFGSVQVSPVQGNCASNAEWFYAYMPYDFAFRANGNGSRDQLRQLCAKASEYGIKVIVDVVANHVNQASGYHDSWWDSNGRVRWNGRVDYNNRYSITHNQLGEYGDVNSEDSQVQQRALEFVRSLKSLGVKGIRWDAAKHIGLPSESCDFWKTVTSEPGMFHYGEILDGPGGDKYSLLKEYARYISVTDSEYSDWAYEQVCNGSVPTGHGSWSVNGVPSAKIVLWGESHDTYSNDGQYGKNTAYVSQDKIDRIWAIGACRKDETALYFSRPAATTRNTIRMGQKGSTHFKSKEIAAVNHFRNAMVGREDYFSASDGVATVTRKDGGAVIVVGAGGSRKVSVSNGGGYVPAGTYKDEVSGNSFTVTASTISGTVGSTGIAVIYDPAEGPVTPPVEPTDPVYVYYNNPGNWSKVNIYLYKGEQNNAWPGQKMTYSASATAGGVTGLYLFEVPEEYVNGGRVIFNDGDGWQYPVDVPGVECGFLLEGKSMACIGAQWIGVDDTPVVTPPSDNGRWTLYFLNTGNWSNVSAYLYTSAGDHSLTGKWPGKAMTYDAATQLYSITFETEEDLSEVNVIFNGTGGQSGDNVKVRNNGIYTVNGDTGQSGTGDVEADEDLPGQYFNLQGIRVAAPEKGNIYILVRGGKVTKVRI